MDDMDDLLSKKFKLYLNTQTTREKFAAYEQIFGVDHPYATLTEWVKIEPKEDQLEISLHEKPIDRIVDISIENVSKSTAGTVSLVCGGFVIGKWLIKPQERKIVKVFDNMPVPISCLEKADCKLVLTHDGLKITLNVEMVSPVMHQWFMDQEWHGIIGKALYKIKEGKIIKLV